MPHAAAVTIRNLSHWFGEESLRQQVLFNVDLEIESGEIVILTGPSGSGKTTLLTLCGALRTIQEGSVNVLGQELHGAGRKQMNATRERMGFIFQAHHLLGALTAQQNVALALGLDNGLSRRERSRRAAEMLDAVGLGHRLDYYPENLSGGQKQRVAIARALVRSPRIVLADEPTASLDRKSGREIIELLLRIARRNGCAILLVTHDVRILDIADRIVELEDGRLTGRGDDIVALRNSELAHLINLERQANLESAIASFSHTQLCDMLDRLMPTFDSGLQLLDVARQEHNSRTLHRFLACALERIRTLLDVRDVALSRFDRATLSNQPYSPLPASDPPQAAPKSPSDHTLDVWLQGRNGALIGSLHLRRPPQASAFSLEEVTALQAIEKGLGVLFDTCLQFDREQADAKEDA